MKQSLEKLLEKLQEKRSHYFKETGWFLLSLGITANRMTFFSLIAGIGAAYFLFSNHFLFVILALLHLLLDSLDGVVARLSKPTNFGPYFDYGTDRLITFLALLKIAWFISSYAYVAILLFLLTNIFYLTADRKAPVLFTRTILIILLIFQLPVLAYLVTGIISLYSLVLQLLWVIDKRKS